LLQTASAHARRLLFSTSGGGACYIQRRRRLLCAAAAGATSGGDICYEKRSTMLQATSKAVVVLRRRCSLHAASDSATSGGGVRYTSRQPVLQATLEDGGDATSSRRWCSKRLVAVLQKDGGGAMFGKWQCYLRLATVLPAWSTPARSLTGANREGWGGRSCRVGFSIPFFACFFLIMWQFVEDDARKVKDDADTC
jgi:hypothetical protein